MSDPYQSDSPAESDPAGCAMKPILTDGNSAREVPGSFFLQRAEIVRAPRVESCVTFLLWHRADIVDEGMRLIMGLYGKASLFRTMRLSWHEGC
jgi:hypothetical protein